MTVAWARTSGVSLFFDALRDKLEHFEVIVGMANAATSAEALAHLRRRCSRLYVFHKHPRQTFHPKIYSWDTGGARPDQATLIVGSSNLTQGGLFSNIEGSLSVTLRPSSNKGDLDVYRQTAAAFGELTRSPFCELIDDDDRIQELLADRYVSTEATLRRRGAEEAADAPKRGRRRAMPEAPPPRAPAIALPALGVTFRSPPGKAKKPPATPTAPVPLVADGRFFVRTLTANDVAKLRGAAGTFEPDLSVTARDAQAAFWGWPDQFHTKERTAGKPRDEWPARARIITSETGAAGERLEFMQWFRPARPRDRRTGTKAHAAEHRFRLGPISRLREIVPAAFDTDGLVVIERCAEDEPDDFVMRFIAAGEPEYADYAGYLTTVRAAHSYGYGLEDVSD